jgi:hypothetical protein
MIQTIIFVFQINEVIDWMVNGELNKVIIAVVIMINLKALAIILNDFLMILFCFLLRSNIMVVIKKYIPDMMNDNIDIVLSFVSLKYKNP